MSDEHDSWFKSAFGVDLGEALDKVTTALAQANKAATQKAESVQGGAIAEVGAGTGSFPLGASVGRGGKNAASDVRAVQRALGIAADGDCGPQTVDAIKAYQRKMGSAKPDGRVDPGGMTERALAGGGQPPVAALSDEPVYGSRPKLAEAAVRGQPTYPTQSSTAVKGDLLDALLQQQTALLQSLANAGSEAEKEQIQEELEGVGAEISSELQTLKATEPTASAAPLEFGETSERFQGVLTADHSQPMRSSGWDPPPRCYDEPSASESWKLEAQAAIEEATSPEGQLLADARRLQNPQLEQRYATASGNFTQPQLDAQRTLRGAKAVAMGAAAAATLGFTGDVGLAELVGTATGAIGSLAKPLVPVTGRATLPPASPGIQPDPVAVDVRGLPKSTMLASATKSGRGGTSPIGRHIQKHAIRPAEAFASSGGNGKANTELGRKFLTELFADPQTTVTSRPHKKYGELVDLRRADGAGAAFTTKGEFVNLLEPYNRIPGWTSSL